MNLDHLTQLAADVVGAAQRQLPPDIRALARSVAVHYQPAPELDIAADDSQSDILGFFAGSPHGTEFSQDDPTPPQIFLYLERLWEYADADVEAFRDEVRVTYLHEVGHYLGWDEDDLAARGLD